MKIKSNKTAKNILFNVEVPNNDNILSYEELDNIFNTQITKSGYKIQDTIYRASVVMDAAYCVYFLDIKSDYTPVLIWSNNYNRKTKAQVAIGFYVNGTDGNNIIITEAKDINVKKDVDVNQLVEELVEKVSDIEYIGKTMYNNMSKAFMTDESFGSILGQLFMNGALRSDQLSTCKKENNKLSYDYSAPIESVWTKFNIILSSMTKTHAQSYLLDNMLVTNVFEEYQPETIVVEYNTVSDSEEVNEILSITTQEEVIEDVITTEIDNQMSIQDQCEDMGVEPEIDVPVKATVIEEQIEEVVEVKEEAPVAEEVTEEAIDFDVTDSTDGEIINTVDEEDEFTLVDETSEDIEFDL